jgi:RNA polymerase-interacting CarD/CdnL/TRCF family regulator
MEFHAGDAVMHWNCGLGQVVGLEERVFSGSKFIYYAIQMRGIIIWVPVEGQLGKRLRLPTSQSGFMEMIATLSGPGEPLPVNQFERSTRLLALLKDNCAESLCRIIRDLFAYQKIHLLNENDGMHLERSRNALLDEWGFVLSISRTQAEIELQRLLASKPLVVTE